MCRSRRELSNEYSLANIGVDTAENELLEVLFNIIQYYSFVSLGAAGPRHAPLRQHHGPAPEGERPPGGGRGGDRQGPGAEGGGAGLSWV